jgi:5-methylcytosine-specific restriction endonuclease McrA
VNRDVVWQVRERAGGRCEYCHIPTLLYPLPFSADHIIARQHGGLTVLENLALSCLHCNSGQTTIYVLAINEPDFLAVRDALLWEQSNALE